jgi:hypothetical protein
VDVDSPALEDTAGRGEFSLLTGKCLCVSCPSRQWSLIQAQDCGCYIFQRNGHGQGSLVAQMASTCVVQDADISLKGRCYLLNSAFQKDGSGCRVLFAHAKTILLRKRANRVQVFRASKELFRGLFA